jgi:lipoate-protein ligase A
MFLKARYIPYCANSPYENMAIDEYLMSYYRKEKMPVLRLYAWKPSGISLGKYQKADDLNMAECKAGKIPVVRRLTGGGAIYHADELTYSFVCSEDDIDCSGVQVKQTFEKLNAFIMLMYEKFGLEPSYAKYRRADENLGLKTGFCFSGSEEYDIIIKGKKIGGNAQGRKKGIIFQHGSVPLAACEDGGKYFACPVVEERFTSLQELLGRSAGPDEAGANMTAAFMETFGADLEPAPLAMEEKQEIVKLLTSKYATNRWNLEGRS